MNTSFPYESTGALTNFSHSSRDSTTNKRKFNKCRCSYYQTPTATFHLLLKGDFVFKLNPGATLSNQSQSRGNIHNYVDNLNSRNGSVGSRKHKMLLSFFNARSVRNKTVDMFYFICGSKVDLIAITETWLTINDSAIKAELCRDGYKLMDHPRTLRRGGGRGPLFRDTLTVKIVDTGEKDSYECSELIVSSSSHKIRRVIVYRPPYSEDHQVPTNVFIDEFSDYLESLYQRKCGSLFS